MLEWFDARSAPGGLRGRAIKSSLINIGNQAVRFVLQYGSMMILARLLTPSDFGLIAMVTAVIGILDLLRDFGLSTAIIQRPNLSQSQLNSLFWCNSGVGFLLCILLFLGGNVVAVIYKEPRLYSIVQLLSINFLLNGLLTQHQALLRRRMQFGVLAVIELTASALGIILGIGMAFAGYGYWSLVGMSLCTTVILLLLSWWFCPWRPSLPRITRDSLSLLAFGGNLTISNFINYYGRNLDKILLGGQYGSSAVAFYSNAYNVLMLPISQISTPITSVVIPALSSLQNERERFRTFYLQALYLVVAITIPIGIVFYLLSKPIVLFMLGHQWLSSVEILKVLVLSLPAQIICNTSGWVIVSMGRTRDLLIIVIVGNCAILSSFFIGLPYGPMGVASAYAITLLLWLFPCMYLAYRKSPISLVQMVSFIFKPLVSGMLVVPFAAWTTSLVINMHYLAQILIVSTAVFVLYAVILLLLFRQYGYFKELIKFIVERRGK